jgi:hypothetical protein
MFIVNKNFAMNFIIEIKLKTEYPIMENHPLEDKIKAIIAKPDKFGDNL